MGDPRGEVLIVDSEQHDDPVPQRLDVAQATHHQGPGTEVGSPEAWAQQASQHG